MKKIVICAENLTKIYPLYDKPIDRMKEALHPLRKKYHKKFHALDNLSFSIEKGETVGIIGKNGAGKSTLLKILTGVLTPTCGNVYISGKISSLLELGTGFNPELTGIENIFFNGLINGFSQEEMEKKVDGILSFADIGEFVNQPVKTYSSGMFVRLAFSVATMIEPDILIVDEALSVGDMFFQAKSMTHMKKMIDNEGVTLLFVSHDVGSVKALCKKGLFLNEGKLLYDGLASVAVEKYFNMKVANEKDIYENNNKLRNLEQASLKKELKNLNALLQTHDKLLFEQNEVFEKMALFQRIQNGKANFENVVLLNELGNKIENVEFGQKLNLSMLLEIKEDIHLLNFGYHIRDANGVELIYADNLVEDIDGLVNVKKGEYYIINFGFKANLKAGLYNITCVASIPINAQIAQVDFCEFIPIAVQFTVETRQPYPIYGFVKWDNEVKVKKI